MGPNANLGPLFDHFGIMLGLFVDHRLTILRWNGAEIGCLAGNRDPTLI